MISRRTFGRGLVTSAIVLLLVVTLIVDWTVGHFADPTWHPHAHYHLLLWHGTLILCSAAALWCLWGRRREEWFALRAAVFTVLAFCLPFYAAALFPNASVYATPELAERGVPSNLIFGGVAITMALVGYVLARNRSQVK